MAKKYIDAELLKDNLRAACLPVDEKGISGMLGDEKSIADYIDDEPDINNEIGELIKEKINHYKDNEDEYNEGYIVGTLVVLVELGLMTTAEADKILLSVAIEPINWEDNENG